ncbi:MAG: phosphoribosylanthranilate isomerase [Leptolyngbya sp. DLM2.Bin15]|nr:MAG: phosphoribosylanthranilate isomerase [Leptolyngbya sp. DLM2.Bin15]
MTTLRVKICGITQVDQGAAIAQMGASALGFICVPDSPRYIPPAQIRAIAEPLPPAVARVGVFANADLDTIKDVVSAAGLTAIQLHGDESTEFCQTLRDHVPNTELIKALRIHTVDAQTMAQPYLNVVDTLLLDAYHPTLRGGTGHALNWDALRRFHPPIPWLLAGGLNPNNVLEALGTLSPNGIDLSSGIERAPGDKAIDQVALLFSRLTLHGYQCRWGG